MKSMAGILAHLTSSARGRNLRVVAWLFVVFLVLVAGFSAGFHVLMEREGRDHSIATGVYWTISTMTTLGFGDITFASDAGRVFSVVVLLSGTLFILVLLPFAFIQFVFLPWMTWREEQRAPSALPEGTSGHLVLTSSDPVTHALIRRARDAGVPYVLVEPDRPTALRLHDEGHHVMVGALDDPATYAAARVDRAVLVAATRSDAVNSNVAVTLREVSPTVPVIATATSEAAAEVLRLAGCDEVLQLGELLGQAAARRVLGRDGRCEVLGRFDDLLVAEAVVLHPDLVGRTPSEVGLGRGAGARVLGRWDRGALLPVAPDAPLTRDAVIVLAGAEDELASYDHRFGLPGPERPVLVIGAGRVGRAALRSLTDSGIPCRVVERLGERVRDDRYVLGDAADVDVLEQAGLREASAAIVTTHDDDVNVFLTISLRRLEPDLQIISRANLERNVASLHRAGADAALSYASVGASTIWNAIGPHDVLVIAEGLVAFRAPVPASFVGAALDDGRVRALTGCSVVAVVRRGVVDLDPVAGRPLEVGDDLVLLGDDGAEHRFRTTT